MNVRGRLIVGTLWVAVAGLMAMTLDVGSLSSIDDIARLVVIVVALFLAAVYLFDLWGLASRHPSE